MLGRLFVRMVKPALSWLYHKSLGLYGPKRLPVPGYVIKALHRWMLAEGYYFGGEPAPTMIRIRNIEFVDRFFYQKRKGNK
jgi:hypothetical protein